MQAHRPSHQPDRPQSELGARPQPSSLLAGTLERQLVQALRTRVEPQPEQPAGTQPPSPAGPISQALADAAAALGQRLAGGQPPQGPAAQVHSQIQASPLKDRHLGASARSLLPCTELCRAWWCVLKGAEGDAVTRSK